MKVREYQERLCTGFEVNCPSHSGDMSLQKVAHVLYFFFFSHTCKITVMQCNCVIDYLQIWHTSKGIQATSGAKLQTKLGNL